MVPSLFPRLRFRILHLPQKPKRLKPKEEGLAPHLGGHRLHLEEIPLGKADAHP